MYDIIERDFDRSCWTDDIEEPEHTGESDCECRMCQLENIAGDDY